MSTAQLPPEIWGLILRQATYVHNLLSTTWDYSPDERIWQGWENDIDGTTGAGMDTKRTIVQVCRAWRDIGVEFLYEAIYISSNPTNHNRLQLENLVEAFTASSVASSTGHGYGWWTKRVSCPHRVLSLIYTTLFALLEQCHNIQIFSVGWDDSGASTVLPHLQVRLSCLLNLRFSHSLRRAEMYVDAGDPPFPDVIPRIVGMTSLGVMVRNDTLDPPDTSSFDLIITLTILLPAYLDAFQAQWNFPSLRNLSLKNVSVRDVGALIPFVKRHRDQIFHLHISTTWAKNDMLPSLLSYVPNIHSLVFDQAAFETLDVWCHSNANFPKLTHLGLTCLLGEREALVVTLKQTLAAGLFPNLAVVRLLNYSNHMSADWRFDQSAMMLCRCRDIRFEDKQGQLIDVEDDNQ